MLNYDFFKSQVIFKHQIIKNSNPATFLNNMNIYYSALLFLISFNYDNQIINNKQSEIKMVLDNLEFNNEVNYIKKLENKNIIYIQKEIDEEIEEFLEDVYEIEDDLIVVLNSGIFYLEDNEYIDKVDYSIFSLGYFNDSSYELKNGNFVKKFEKCINIGYNTTGNTSFPGISIGFPLYNNHYNFYNSTEIFDEIIKENFINLYQEFENIITNINNYNLLNLFGNNKKIIEKYDNLKYISIQDMLNFLNLKHDINILYQDNDYLLINKDNFIYPELLNKFKQNFLDKLNIYYEKFNEKFKTSKILEILTNDLKNVEMNIDMESGKEIKNKDVSISKNKKVSLDNYLKNIDKSISDTILF